jgi:hypothetical protein
MGLQTSITPEIMVKLSALEAGYEEYGLYCTITRELLRYDEGQHLCDLARVLRASFGDFDELVVPAVLEAADLVRPTVDLLANAYDEPVDRTLRTGTDATQAQFQAALRDFDFEEIMSRANRVATLCRQSAVRFDVDRATGEYLGEVVPPDRYEVKTHPLNAQRVTAFGWWTQDEGVSETDSIAWVWTPEFLFWLRRRGVNGCVWDAMGTSREVEKYEDSPDAGKIRNPYGLIPVVFLREGWSTSCFKPPADEALWLAQRSINAKLVQRNHNLKELAYSLKVLYGRWDAGQVLSPSRPVVVPTDTGSGVETRMEFLSPDAYITEHAEAILEVYNCVSRSKGLDPDYLLGKRSAASGYALELKDRRLAEQYGRQSRARTRDEFKAFEILAALGKGPAPTRYQFPPADQVSIVFPPRRVSRDRREEWDLLVDQYDRGVVPPDDLVQFVRPDLVDEQAVTKYLGSVATRQAEFPAVGGGSVLGGDLTGFLGG